MIRIAYILTPIEFGGAERVNLTFLRNVNRDRFDVFPILLTRPWENRNFFIEELRGMYPIYKISVALRPRSEGRDYLRILRCIKNLYTVLSKGSFHLMHTHGYFADIIGMPVSRMLRIPHISTCHGFISNDRSLNMYNKLDRFSLRYCDKVIAVSEELRDDLVIHGIKESKIAVIENALGNLYKAGTLSQSRASKREQLKLAEDECVVGYAGRLSDEKGIHYLIEAGSILKGKGEAFKILIIGDGPKRKELENLAIEKGLEKEILFAGFQTNVGEWLPALDVFVLPSLTEGAPMALLEAMAVGIPIVATHVGGVPMILEDGVAGFLVAPANPEGLAEKLEVLLERPSLRSQLAEGARKAMERRPTVYEWCRQIESEYCALVQIQ